MNNAIAFAKEIKQKKYAIEKSNSANLKKQYQKSIKRGIADLKLQPVYVLQEGFKKNGKTYRKITYRADFEYIRDGKTFVEDVKGMKTEVYKLKKKLFEYKYPDLGIVEV